jgi:hypothetical protein
MHMSEFVWNFSILSTVNNNNKSKFSLTRGSILNFLNSSLNVTLLLTPAISKEGWQGPSRLGCKGNGKEIWKKREKEKRYDRDKGKEEWGRGIIIGQTNKRKTRERGGRRCWHEMGKEGKNVKLRHETSHSSFNFNELYTSNTKCLPRLNLALNFCVCLFICYFRRNTACTSEQTKLCTYQFASVYFVMTINTNIQLRTAVWLSHMHNTKILTPDAIQVHCAVVCRYNYNYNFYGKILSPCGWKSTSLRPLQLLHIQENLRLPPDKAYWYFVSFVHVITLSKQNINCN